jgi:hypothetical protein
VATSVSRFTASKLAQGGIAASVVNGLPRQMFVTTEFCVQYGQYARQKLASQSIL